MSLEGLEELKANLQRVDDWTKPAIKKALEKAAGNTINKIKSKDHLWGKTLSRQTVKEHPHKEFYSWSQELLNSIRRSEVSIKIAGGAEIEIRAGDKTIDYAASVELGGPNRRAFPFLKPGLEETQGENIIIMAEEIKRAF